MALKAKKAKKASPRKAKSEEGEEELLELNRTVAVVSLKKPFADWLNSLPDAGDIDWTEAAQETQHVVLLPGETLDGDEATAEVIAHYWGQIAVHIFDEWVFDADLWPDDFSLVQFFEWFDVALIDSPVIDLVPDEPLILD